MPPVADLVFDMRFLDNPHWDARAAPADRPGRGGRRAYPQAIPPSPRPSREIRDLLLELLPRYAAQGKSLRQHRLRLHRRAAPLGVHGRAGSPQALREAGFSPTLLHRNLGSRAADTDRRGRHRAMTALPIADLAGASGPQLTSMRIPHDRHDPGHPRPPGRGIRPRDGACRRRSRPTSRPSASARNDDMEARRASEIANAIKQVDSGDGAVILTDLFGGTPSNLAISLMKAGKIEVIAGINLPMLIRLAGARKAWAWPTRPPPRATPGATTSPSRPNSSGRTPERRPDSAWARPRRDGRRSSTSAGCTRAPAPSSSTRWPRWTAATVRVTKDGHSAAGGSILGLMMLGAAKGDTIEIARHRRGGRSARWPSWSGWSRTASARIDGRTHAPQQITGFSNPTVKSLRALRDKKHRRREGRFLAEGLRLLTDARESGRLPEMLVMADGARSAPAAGRAGGGRRRGRRRGDRDRRADILAKITGKDNPQAVAGVFAEFDTVARSARSRTPRRSGWWPRRCAIRAISAPCCAPATRSARAG